MIKNIFARKILENHNVNQIAKNLNKTPKEIYNGKTLDSEKLIDIDTILISSRHLYRMPYSLHEKSGLCSIPIQPNQILKFEKELAKPENVKVNKELRFLDKNNIQPNQAKGLFDKALAEKTNREDKLEFQNKEIKPVDIPESAIPEQFFPPCIKNILKGIEDGKKRSLFILTNFLISVGWDYDKIEALLKKWNKNNPEPLREVLIVGQLRYHKQQKKKILPPNCQNQMYYKDFGVCKPDNLCNRIKNPVNYAKRKTRFLNKEPKSSKKG
jgi:DNA primase large subunit